MRLSRKKHNVLDVRAFHATSIPRAASVHRETSGSFLSTFTLLSHGDLFLTQNQTPVR